MVIRYCQIPTLGELRQVDQAGGCERLHTHDYWVLTMVLAGSLTLRLEGGECLLGPKNVCVIAPHVPHAVCAYGPDFGGIYVLTLREFHFTDVGADDFASLCEELFGEPTPERRRNLLETWVADQSAGEVIESESGENASWHRARKIKELLDAEVASVPYVSALVERFPGSQAHCNRLFKVRYGVSLQTYFLNRKAERAKALLKTDLDLSAVAQQSGFFDQSHFTRVFRGLFQVSPQAFRRAHRESSQHSHTR